MKHFLLALQFLTIIPVKIRGTVSDKDISRSLLFFPIAGALIGWILCCVLGLLSFLPQIVLAAVLLAANSVITGGLHLDGFADTCDGLCGTHSAEKSLEIMRDSRVGAMGLIGIVCLLVLKFSLLTAVAGLLMWKTLICMGMISRWMQVFACYSGDYPRKEGKAKLFVGSVLLKDLAAGGTIVFMLTALLCGIKGVMGFVFTFACVFVFKLFVRKKISGMTGDTIGAASEIAEVIILLSALIF
ncbi:MAG: adenosylcobinamide-GDP ribazoletransferase [Candidatus Omnitrophota bacterium]